MRATEYTVQDEIVFFSLHPETPAPRLGRLISSSRILFTPEQGTPFNLGGSQDDR